MPDYATLYVADPSLLGSRVLDTFPSIVKYESMSAGEDATGLKLFLEGATITMNFMPPDDRREHFEGMKGWVQSVLEDRDQLLYVLSRIYWAEMPVGCVIEPGFDEEGRLKEFLFSFNDRLNGLLFFADTIFDWDGNPIAGYYYDVEQQQSP
jgi:hypothetical protein